MIYDDVITISDLSVVYRFMELWVRSLAMWDNVVVIFELLIRQLICLILAARRTQEILMLRKELQYDITKREN